MKKLNIIVTITLMSLLLLATVGCQPGETDVVEVITVFKFKPGTPVPPGGWALVPVNPHPDNVQWVFNPGEKMYLGLRISDRIEEEVTFSRYVFLNEDMGEEVEVGSTDALGPFKPGQKLLVAFDDPWPVPAVPGTYRLKIYLDEVVVASAIFEVSSEIIPALPPITSPPPPKTDWEEGSPPPEGIEGWEQPRSLTEDEKTEVIEIALNSQRALEWLQGRTDYRIGSVDWYAIIWSSNGESGNWWSLEYDRVVKEGIPDFVSPHALWYPGVTIAVGEGTIYQMQIAIDLDAGKAAMMMGPYPSLSSPDRFRNIQEYALEVVRATYEEIIEELFDKRQLYDKISMTGYSGTDITLSFYSHADPEIVTLVRAMIDNKVPGISLIVKENVPAPTSKVPTNTQISKEQAIEIASKTLPALIVARAGIKAERHGWYWEVIFDNLNAEAEELMPWPLKSPPPPPPGQPEEDPYTGIWQSVIITIDAQTGDLKSTSARQSPEPGPYVSQEQAILSAMETILQTPVEINWGVKATRFGKAQVEAYLRGDTWIVLFWEEGSTDNRFSVYVDAVNGLPTGVNRG